MNVSLCGNYEADMKLNDKRNGWCRNSIGIFMLDYSDLLANLIQITTNNAN